MVQKHFIQVSVYYLLVHSMLMLGNNHATAHRYSENCILLTL